MESEKKFSIYRLCRNKKTEDRLKSESEKYGFEWVHLAGSQNYFEFLSKVISECPDDFALVCHDDVVLPVDIQRKVDAAIANADEEFGKDSWGIIGNAGVEYLSLKISRFLRDSHFSTVPPGSSKSIPVVFIDDNTLLLNLKNLREKAVSFPKEFGGFELFGFVLLVECYKKNLVSAIDSNLFVMHKSLGDRTAFDKAIKSKQFENYWRSSFSNHSIETINGAKKIGWEKEVSKKDFYVFVSDVLKDLYAKRNKKNIYIVTRTTLDRKNMLRRNLEAVRKANSTYAKDLNLKVVLSINNIDFQAAKATIESLKKEYSDLDIDFLFVERSKDKYPRVSAIEEAVRSVPDEKNSHIWIVDADDFVLPEALKYFPIILNDKQILVANSVVFEEKWDNEKNTSAPVASKKKKIFDTKEYYKCFLGDNYVPMCSAIYPAKLLMKIFEDYSLRGDYFEDYTIFMLAQNEMDVAHYPISIAGISFHGDNTVAEKNRTHWDHSYATFVSEIVNSNLIRNWVFDFANGTGIGEINAVSTKRKNIFQLEQELKFIKSSKFWKMRELYIKLKAYLLFRTH